MNIRTFEKSFDNKYPISVIQIRLKEKNFALEQLSIREKKGWIYNLSKGWWMLPHTLDYNYHRAAICNAMYEPSYISLEFALRYYNIIPEGVFTITACTTKKTQRFDTFAGSYIYRSLAPRLFRGYEVKTLGDYKNIRIATPEKALCDYIYLHPEISGVEDFEEMRINYLIRNEIASNKKLQEYARLYPKSTQKNINYFLDYITSF